MLLSTVLISMNLSAANIVDFQLHRGLDYIYQFNNKNKTFLHFDRICIEIFLTTIVSILVNATKLKIKEFAGVTVQMILHCVCLYGDDCIRNVMYLHGVPKGQAHFQCKPKQILIRTSFFIKFQ